MADPEVLAALQYLQEQRNQRVIDDLLAAPPPVPPVWTAAEIAARLWPEAPSPPIDDAELQEAIRVLRGLDPQEETLPMQAQPEGGAGGPVIPFPPSRGGLGGSFPVGADRPWAPELGDTMHEAFLNWLLDPMSTPFNQPKVALSAKQRLAAVTAALPQARTPAQQKRLMGLQAAYFHEARNEGHA